jgi:hypothetical protein
MSKEELDPDGPALRLEVTQDANTPVVAQQGEPGPDNPLKNPFSSEHWILNGLSNSLSDLVGGDKIAEWSWVAADHRRPSGERWEAGAKLVGFTALQVGGGVVTKGAGKLGGRLLGFGDDAGRLTTLFGSEASTITSREAAERALETATREAGEEALEKGLGGAGDSIATSSRGGAVDDAFAGRIGPERQLPPGPSQGRLNQLEGDAFETAAIDELRLTKNRLRVTGNTRRGLTNTEPDLMDRVRAGVTDIKNELKLSFDKQLQAQADVARQQSTSFNLIISSRTQTVSIPLQRAINRSGGIVV